MKNATSFPDILINCISFIPEVLFIIFDLFLPKICLLEGLFCHKESKVVLRGIVAIGCIENIHVIILSM